MTPCVQFWAESQKGYGKGDGKGVWQSMKWHKITSAPADTHGPPKANLTLTAAAFRLPPSAFRLPSPAILKWLILAVALALADVHGQLLGAFHQGGHVVEASLTLTRSLLITSGPGWGPENPSAANPLYWARCLRPSSPVRPFSNQLVVPGLKPKCPFSKSFSLAPCATPVSVSQMRTPFPTKKVP